VDKANELLQGGFDEDLNRRFAIEPREVAVYHRSAEGVDLRSIFCIEETRTLSVNWTLSFENRVYQINPGSTNYSPASRKVLVRRYLDGELHMFYRGNDADFEEINPGKKEKKKKFIKGRNTRPPGASYSSTPASDHPWRKQFLPSRPSPRHP
jgi:hypothetical protein